MHLSLLPLVLAALALPAATVSAQAAHHLERASVSCKATTDCSKAGYSLPQNSHYACNKARGVCTWGCNTGYTSTGSSCVSSSTTVSARDRKPTAPAATPKLKTTYAGKGFLDKFFFMSDADPTHGQVTYLPKSSALSLGLAKLTSSSTVLLSIDRTSKLAAGVPRKSVRISSLETYDPGHLIIADFKHAPVGCGAWGAFWTFNYPWPQSGEIDIYEGVNARTFNQYTLHTASGCTRSGSSTGSLVGAESNCNAGNGNTGCTTFDYDPTSFGTGFNKAGGGVFAVLYAETGISIWRWPRNKIPSDVTKGAPRWKGWGKPVAAFDGKTCDTRTYFGKQMLTFDITACGDWAGATSVWQDKSQSGACYPKYKTCAAAVQDPKAFSEAYFEVNYIKVFTV